MRRRLGKSERKAKRKIESILSERESLSKNSPLTAIHSRHYLVPEIVEFEGIIYRRIDVVRIYTSRKEQILVEGDTHLVSVYLWKGIYSPDNLSDYAPN